LSLTIEALRLKWSHGGSVDQWWQIRIILVRSRIRIRIKLKRKEISGSPLKRCGSATLTASENENDDIFKTRKEYGFNKIRQ
jgi:hypothetical protein